VKINYSIRIKGKTIQRGDFDPKSPLFDRQEEERDDG